jgi:hypothetical protein
LTFEKVKYFIIYNLPALGLANAKRRIDLLPRKFDQPLSRILPHLERSISSPFLAPEHDENAGARIDRITSWERGDAAEEN